MLRVITIKSDNAIFKLYLHLKLAVDKSGMIKNNKKDIRRYYSSQEISISLKIITVSYLINWQKET